MFIETYFKHSISKDLTKLNFIKLQNNFEIHLFLHFLMY
jgi:hypothetical protein